MVGKFAQSSVDNTIHSYFSIIIFFESFPWVFLEHQLTWYTNVPWERGREKVWQPKIVGRGGVGGGGRQEPRPSLQMEGGGGGSASAVTLQSVWEGTGGEAGKAVTTPYSPARAGYQLLDCFNATPWADLAASQHLGEEERAEKKSSSWYDLKKSQTTPAWITPRSEARQEEKSLKTGLHKKCTFEANAGDDQFARDSMCTANHTLQNIKSVPSPEEEKDFFYNPLHTNIPPKTDLRFKHFKLNLIKFSRLRT